MSVRVIRQETTDTPRLTNEYPGATRWESDDRGNLTIIHSDTEKPWLQNGRVIAFYNAYAWDYAEYYE